MTSWAPSDPQKAVFYARLGVGFGWEPRKQQIRDVPPVAGPPNWDKLESEWILTQHVPVEALSEESSTWVL